MIPETFHFLRPLWLLALVPAAVVLWAARRRDEHASAWRRLVDQHLLRHLLFTDGGGTHRWPLALAALGWLAASTAMAGPTWEQIPQPTFSSVEPTVVVLDMSPAMNADDLSPSRLTRARHKLHDILARTRGGQVGLVLYTDEPFVAAPLTDDARVIEEMIPTLDSGLMPLRSGRADRAIDQAKTLLDHAGTPTGRIVLITGGSDDHADGALQAARSVAASGRRLSVLGAGTEAGAPLRDARGRTISDLDGKPVLAHLDAAALEALATAGGGQYAALSVDDGDLSALVPARGTGTVQSAQAGSSAQADVWRDAGIWLVLLPLAMAPLAFRRGLIAGLAFALLLAGPARAEASVASTWSDLWSRRDQQAQSALQAGDPAQAAKLFEDPSWKAAAQYQTGSFDESAQAYGALPGAENHYNLGNALARSGKLEDAIRAYDEVLASLPDHADAKFNRELVQRLLDEQRKQKQEQQQEQQQAGSGEQNQEQQQGGQGQQDQQQNGQDKQNQSQQAEQKGQQGQSSEDKQDGNQGQAVAGPSQDQNGQGDGDASASQPKDSNQASADQPKSDAQDANQANAQNDAQQQNQEEQNAQQANAQDQSSQEDGNQAQPEEQARAQAQQGAKPESGQKDDNQQASAARANDEKAERDRSLAEKLSQALAGDPDESKDAEKADERAAGDAHADNADQRPMTEQEQAREQMLRNIPDDPGGLLRAKIRRRYAEKRYSQQEVISPW